MTFKSDIHIGAVKKVKDCYKFTIKEFVEIFGLDKYEEAMIDAVNIVIKEKKYSY